MAWSEDLRTYLVRAGTIGLNMSEIHSLMKNSATVIQINAELEGWRSEGKVQLFKRPSKGRPQLIWRATTELAEKPDD